MRNIRKNYDNPSDTGVILRREPRGFNAAGIQQMQDFVTPTRDLVIACCFVYCGPYR